MSDERNDSILLPTPLERAVRKLIETPPTPGDIEALKAQIEICYAQRSTATARPGAERRKANARLREAFLRAKAGRRPLRLNVTGDLRNPRKQREKTN